MVARAEGIRTRKPRRHPPLEISRPWTRVLQFAADVAAGVNVANAVRQVTCGWLYCSH